MKSFEDEVEQRILGYANNKGLQSSAAAFMYESIKAAYSYNFKSLGRSIIQYPQDMIAMQELIWEVRPDLIIETGIAHGGSLIMSASMMAILDYCDAFQSGQLLDPSRPTRKVLGIDIDIRAHNRSAIEAHPMANRIEMIEASSIDPETIGLVQRRAGSADSILVCLDSNHTHEHVLAELQAYAPLTSIGSYCVVFDSIIEDVSDDMYPDRPWGRGNNPKTAIGAFLEKNGQFEIDRQIENKLLVTVSPNGYLKRTR